MRKLIVFFAFALVSLSAFADSPTLPGQVTYGSQLAHYPINGIKGCQLSCGTTHTAIACTTPGFTVRTRVVCNTSDTDIYISGSDVTSSAGFLLKVGACITALPDSQSGTALSMQCAVSGGGKALSVIEGG